MLFRALGALFSRRTSRIVSVIVLVFAVAMVAGAITTTVTDLNLRANGVTTDATIVNVNVSHNYSHTNHTYTTTYTTQITYTTADGSLHQASIAGSSSQHAGETIAVVYDPSHPSTVQDKGSLTGLWWIGPALLLLLALAFGWLGSRLWRRASRLSEMQLA